MNMELQALAGLRQGVRQHQCLWSSHKTRGFSSSCDDSTRSYVVGPSLRNASLLRGQRIGSVVVVSCSSGGAESGGKQMKQVVQLKAGSPVVVTEAPPLLKTAEPMPMMRPNNGLINIGDAGRVIDRRPKGVWAVRFAVGAYLIDRKYFEPLEL